MADKTNSKTQSRSSTTWHLPEQYEYLFQQANDAILIHDVAGQIIDANPRAVSLYGFSRQDLLTHKIQDLVHEELRDEMNGIVNKILEQGTLCFEIDFISANAHTLTAEVSSSLLKLPGWNAIQHIIRDISERKHREKFLQDSHSKLYSIIKAVSDIIYRIDIDCIITYISDTIREYGYEPSELIGKNIFDLVHPDDREKAQFRLNERRTGDRRTRSFEIRLKTKASKYVPFDVHATGIYIEPTFLLEAEGIYSTDVPESRSFLGSQGIARDITERKIAERILLESERRLNCILSSMVDTVLVFNESGKIVNHHSQNDPAYLPVEKYLDKKTTEVFPRHVIKIFEQAFSANKLNQVSEQEFWLEFDHELKWYSSKLSPIFIEDKFRGSVAVIRDVTERKKFEDSLQRKNQQQEQLLKTVKYLNESLNLTEVLTRIGHGAKQMLKADGCTIYLLETDGVILTPVIALDPEYQDEILATPITIHNSLTGQSVLAGKGLIFNHAEDSSGGFHIPGTPEKEPEHLIVAPLMVDSKVLGAVCLDRLKKIFTAEDLRLVETFASLAATALKNAKSHSDLQIEIERNKAIQRALTDSEEKFRNLAEQSPNMIFITIQDKIVYANRRCEEVMGYQRDECYAPDFNIFELISPEDHASIRSNFIKQIKGMDIAPTEYTLVTRNQKRIESLITTKLITYDGKPAILGIVVDIGDLKKAEDALRRSEEKYRKFFEEDLTGDYISKPDGKLLSCNSAFLRIFGFKNKKEALRTNVTALYPDPIQRQILLDQLKQKRKLEYYEMELQKNDGKPIFIIANMTGKFDEAGNLLEIMGYLFDNTEQKMLEQKFRQAQKMEAIGRLAGGVAHDFNNLLTIINGYSELILYRTSPTDRLVKDIQQIKKAGEKASQLTNQLLAFSRQQVRQIKPVNLNSVVMDVNKMLYRLIGEDIELLLKLHPDLGIIKADSGQLEQILMNLAVNARDAMPQGGKLTIETNNVKYKKEYVHTHLTVQPAGEYVMLAVQDTGIGMDEETRSHIFEPFFTTKPYGKGTGLGLSTVYGIVKQSDGYIWVDSTPGAGSIFRIYFPRVREKVSPAKIPQRISGTLKGDETILLVEDEDLVRELAVRILKEAGYTVLEASRGKEALSVANHYQETIHLIVTDIIMPGISGKKLAEQIKNHRPAIKVLFMSGYTHEIISHEGNLENGMQFLQKPFSPEHLLQAVRNIIDQNNRH